VHASDHPQERPCRVYGEEDVVEDDEDLEGARVRDPVGLAGRVVVCEVCRDCVHRCDGERNADIEECRVDVRRDQDALRDDEGGFAGGEGGRERGGWEREVDAA